VSEELHKASQKEEMKKPKRKGNSHNNCGGECEQNNTSLRGVTEKAKLLSLKGTYFTEFNSETQGIRGRERDQTKG
jgi:hypothetical protein